MPVMRNTLLWASQNNWLKAHVPQWKFTKRAVRKFLPGEQLDDALVAALKLKDKGITSTFTALGENITDIAEADAELEHYLGAYDEIAQAGTDTEISVKLTHLGLDLDPKRTVSHVAALADRAKAAGGWLWIDMESSEYVQATIDIYREVMDGRDNVGICLQAYLHRTPDDIADLAALSPGIRLVKGAYREPENVAATDKEEVDKRFVFVAKALLENTDAIRVALASHDVDLLDQLSAHAAANGVGKDKYEIQMLYGIRVADQERLAAEGYNMRTLVAYGDGWYPWYMRRLAERPANMGFVVKSMFARG